MPGLLVLALLGLASPALAQDELDEVLEGFEEEEPPESDEGAPPGAEDPDSAPAWDLSGALSLGSSFNYAQSAPGPGAPDHRGLARLRAELFLELDLDLPGGWEARVAGRGFRDYAYAIKGRSDYPDELLESYERELEFQELWLRGRLREDLDLKVGRQIVVWGRSDSIRVLDVLNPLDNREPGLVDIEDLRLPVVMTRLDWYAGPWNLTGIAVHESRFDEAPVPGSDFFPFPGPLPEERTPANGGRDTEWALALTGIFPGWDLSLHWARIFDDRAHVVSLAPLRSEHARLTLLGASANLAFGNWLLKGEAARLSGLEFFAAPGDDKVRLDAMLGIEYSGFHETAIAVEVASRHLRDWDPALAAPPDAARRNTLETAIRYTAEFRHDTLRVVALALLFGTHAEDGSAVRLSIEYDLRDAVTLGAGLLLFNDGDGDSPLFDAAEHNDRVFASVKYSF